MTGVDVVIHFICVLVLACFCTILTMQNWASAFNLQSTRITLLYYLYSIFFTVGLTSVLYSLFRNVKERIQVEKFQDHQTFILSFTGLGIFFVAILIVDSLNLANLAYCASSYISMNCNIPKMVGFTLFHISKPAYLAMQLMFIIWVRYNRLSQGYLLISKIAHSVNIAINVALIIYCSSYETRLLQDNYEKPDDVKTTYNFFNCTHDNSSAHGSINPLEEVCVAANTTLLNFNRSLFPYVFPMHVQFASLAISVMIGQIATTSSENTESEDEDDQSQTLETPTPETPSTWRNIQTWMATFGGTENEEETPLVEGDRQPTFSPLLIFGLFVCSMQIIAGVVGNQDLSGTLWFYITINIFWHCFLIAASVRILCYMQMKSRTVLHTPLPASAIVILISSACAYNMYFYKLIANTDIVARPLNEWDAILNQTGLNDAGLYWFTITDAIAYCLRILSVVLQSLIIIRICRELSMRTACSPLTGKVKIALYYLLVTNITSWMWDSIIGINRHNIIDTAYYSDDIWISLQRAFMPGFLYFEFHSFMILAEYMIAQYYNTPPERSPSNETLTSEINCSRIDSIRNRHYDTM